MNFPSQIALSFICNVLAGREEQVERSKCPAMYFNFFFAGETDGTDSKTELGFDTCCGCVVSAEWKSPQNILQLVHLFLKLFS